MYVYIYVYVQDSSARCMRRKAVCISRRIHQLIVNVKKWANTFTTKSAFNVTFKYLGILVKGFGYRKISGLVRRPKSIKLKTASSRSRWG